MIPAILSVVFVVYLYQSLNEASSPAAEMLSDSEPAGNKSDSTEVEQLAARLQKLRIKVTKLTERAHFTGKQA